MAALVKVTDSAAMGDFKESPDLYCIVYHLNLGLGISLFLSCMVLYAISCWYRQLPLTWVPNVDDHITTAP